MDINQNRQIAYQDDEIDLFELGRKIWSYKKFICIVTIISFVLSVVYVLTIIPLYRASALVETGFYKNDNDQEVLIANTADSIQKLTVAYIDLLKGVQGLDFYVEKISEVKNNKKFFNIDVLAKSNESAINQINKMVNDLSSQHQNALNTYLENKKVQLSNIEHQIDFLKNNKIVEKQEQIKYVKDMQLPRIDRQILHIQESTMPAIKSDIDTIDKVTLPTLEKTIESSRKRLQKYEAELENLQSNTKGLNSESILQRQIMQQFVQDKIYSIEQDILSLGEQVKLIITQTKPNAQDRLDKLINVDLENLQSEKDDLANNKLPALQRELAVLQTEELSRLLDQKSLIELRLKPYNYQNTAIVSDIVTSERPVKPRKKIIVLIVSLSGFMSSIFAVLLYDLIINRVKKDKG